MIYTLCHKIVTSVCDAFVDLSTDHNISDALFTDFRLMYIGILIAVIGGLTILRRLAL
jgi:hypothetical protein